MSESLHRWAKERPVQIAALSFAICCTIWFIFFDNGRKVAILMTFLLGGFFSKEGSKSQDRENLRYIKFNRVFRGVALTIIILPSILSFLLRKAFGIDNFPQYGSPLTLICTTALARRLLSLLLFNGQDSSGESPDIVEQPQP